MLVYDCDIADCGRNGITLGGVRSIEWSRNVEIDSCVFRGSIDTQMIDLELHGDRLAKPSQFNRNLYIHDCVFEPQSPEDSVDRDQFAMVLYAVLDFRVERCDIRGPVLVRNGHGEFKHNTGGVTQLTIDRFSVVDVSNTLFSLSPMQRKANRERAGILVVRRDDHSPLRFSLRDCEISATHLERAMEISDCPEVIIQNNNFDLHDSVDSWLIHANSENMNVLVKQNRGLPQPQVQETNGRDIALTGDM